MVQIDDFLDSVTDKEVVLWGVSNDHLAFIEVHGISWSTFWWSLTLSTSRPGICGSGEDLLDVGWVFGNESAWPLSLVCQVVHKLKLVNIGACCNGCDVVSGLGALSIPDNGSPLDEELFPLVPVSVVNAARVLLLLVNIGLMSDVKDGVDHFLSLVCLTKLFGLLILLAHKVISVLERVDFSAHLITHGIEHLLLLEDGVLGVKLLTLVVLGFSELPVFGDNASALISPPTLISQLLFLLGVSSHAFEHLGLASA